MPYNPNPFEFVPFGKEVKLINPLEWNLCDKLYSGWLDVSLTALTPIHIVGSQKPVSGKEGRRIDSSKFYRQDDIPTIPGSSIKGMLRAFLEALTCGWVSQVNNEYHKIKGTRHVGFAALTDNKDILQKSAVPKAFKPGINLQKIDIPSYMFGIVTGTDTTASKSEALHGKIFIEDCSLSKSVLQASLMPDVEGDAFMGGSHPSASSWWYMLPDEIWKRNTAGNTVAEFVGRRFRGRKFYFHQEPAKCIAWYDKEWVKLHQRPKKPPIPYYKYTVESMKPNANGAFRIYIHRLPEPFLAMLCLALSPGHNIRHKIGYGKAYGYGSIDLKIKEAQLRCEKSADWPDALSDHKSLVANILECAFSQDNLKSLGIANWIDQASLKIMARILGFHLNDKEQKDMIFTYPPFDRSNFARALQFTEVESILTTKGVQQHETHPLSYLMTYQDDKKACYNHGENIASSLSGIKKTIHLTVYQKNAIGYQDIIMKRTP